MANLTPIFLSLVLTLVSAYPEQGIWNVSMNNAKGLIGISKAMYNNSQVQISFKCDTVGDGQPVTISMTWMLRSSECAQEYIDTPQDDTTLRNYFNQPTAQHFPGVSQVQYVQSAAYSVVCDGNPVIVEVDEVELTNPIIKKTYFTTTTKAAPPPTKPGPTAASAAKQPPKVTTPAAPAAAPAATAAPPPVNAAPATAAPTEPPKSKTTTKKAGSRKKRAVDQKTAKASTKAPEATADTGMKHPDDVQHLQTLIRTWEDGIFLFMIQAEATGDSAAKFNATVEIAMVGEYGYLAALEWPLLPFYGCMCAVYIIYGLVWLVLSFCNWRDLLRIQFWIGGVIFLGMLEKAVFLAEYESVNKTGRSVQGALLLAEIVSCLKRSISRMLVVIVSLGFGIVKPRLGPMFPRVMAMGGLYFLVSAIEGCLRASNSKSDNSLEQVIAAVPLAVLDAAICWWIFNSLLQTTRTLRLRRNLVKLSLYRHFTNTLIFAVIASVAFMVWSLTQHRLSKCITDWKELWVDEAFWHLLFSVILLVITILWRPSANNQRYAFSPLLDAADDEAEEPMINDAFQGMKMRGKGQSNGSPKQKNKADEDLKWIEDNIPASVADTALPSLMDSDEEIMNTKYEMSKME